jgi:hypothetical protein
VSTVCAPSSKPEAAGRYLRHAIAPDAPAPKSVRLIMHGMIKIKGWNEFEAEETIVASRSMSWDARTKLFGLPVSGFDRVIQGFSETQWKLFGLLPIAGARGQNVSRSAVARMATVDAAEFA